nr:ribosomal protein L20 [Dinophyceae sp. MRD-151]
MTRVKRGAVARQRRKKVLSSTKGAIGSNSYLFRIAQQHAIKSISYAYHGRRERKRQYRALWVTRLNTIIQSCGQKYSYFFNYTRKKKHLLNRKTLAQLALYDPIIFWTLIGLGNFIKN